MRTLTLILLASVAWGQPSISNVTVSGNVDFHSAAATIPDRSGAGSPVGTNCVRVGESYFQIGATAGQNTWKATTFATPCTWTLQGGSGSGTVTSVGWTGGIVSVATATSTPAFTIAGTSGGVPYFNSGSTWLSSGAMAAGQFMLGGGAGSAPTTSFSIVPVANGGTGLGTLTAHAVYVGNGTSAPAAVGLGTTGMVLTSNGASADPTFQSVTGTGTVTVVGAGALCSTCLVSGGGTTTLQTPSATSTLDSSGNLSTPGGVSAGVGGANAGYLDLAQGLPPSAGTTLVRIYAGTAVTSYTMRVPSLAASGFIYGTNTSGDVVQSFVSTVPVANGGTGTASTLTGLVRGNSSAMTAAELSGDVSTSGSNAVTIGAAKVTPANLKASTWDAQTDAATITWAIGSVLNAQASVTLGGNRTLNITNPVVGGNYLLRVTQDGSGSRTLTLGTGCAWKVIGGGGGAVTLSSTAGAVDIIAFGYDGSSCWANVGKNYN